METAEGPSRLAKETEAPPNYSLIKNIHLGFPVPAGSENLQLVQGDYWYFHYGCDDFDDKGWGCGYRVLQTLCSWIDPEAAPLSLREMIAVVAEMDIHDSQKPGHGGRHIENPWIGTFEGFLIIDRVYDVSCRIDFVKSPRELGDRMSLVRSHFATVGSPIFMGGDRDCYGKCVVGVCTVGSLHHLLVLRNESYPHIMLDRPSHNSKLLTVLSFLKDTKQREVELDMVSFIFALETIEAKLSIVSRESLLSFWKTRLFDRKKYWPSLLMKDPHYSGTLGNREDAYRKGCLKWVPVSEFLDESFYNLLMPLSHGSLKYRPVRCELYRSIGIAKGTIDKKNI